MRCHLVSFKNAFFSPVISFFLTTSDSQGTLHLTLGLVGMHSAPASMWALKFSYCHSEYVFHGIKRRNHWTQLALCLHIRTFMSIFLFQHKNVYIYIYIYMNRTLAWWLECSPMAKVQSQVESYQRLKKWYLMPPCLTLSIIRFGSRVKWSNSGKRVAPSLTPWGCSYRKGNLRVTLDYDYDTNIYIYIDIYPCIPVNLSKKKRIYISTVWASW